MSVILYPCIAMSMDLFALCVASSVSKSTGRWHPHIAGIQACWLTGGLLQSTNRFPTSTGAVHKYVTLSGAFVDAVEQVCDSFLQRGLSGDGRLSSTIFLKYKSNM